MAATENEGPRADVELRLPADSAYVSVLRTTTAGLAARLDFPIDDIEDLRIAVGEASALVLPEAEPGSDLLCQFFLRPGRADRAGRRSPRPARSTPTTTASPGRCSPPSPPAPSATSDDGRFTVTLSTHAACQEPGSDVTA